MHTDLPSSASGPCSSPFDRDALLAHARLLQRGREGAPLRAFLRGKNLGLVCATEDNDDARLFRSAAVALGAQVAQIRPSVPEPGTSAEETLMNTARMLGRLYDGIECQGLAPSLVRRLGRDAGVPVFDGLASPCHPTAALAHHLVGTESIESKRLLILQAVLLLSLLNLNPASGSAPPEGMP